MWVGKQTFYLYYLSDSLAHFFPPVFLKEGFLLQLQQALCTDTQYTLHEIFAFISFKPTVIDGLAGLVECKTKDKWTEVSRAEELTKEVNNWRLSYQTKVRGDSPSL